MVAQCEGLIITPKASHDIAEQCVRSSHVWHYTIGKAVCKVIIRMAPCDITPLCGRSARVHVAIVVTAALCVRSSRLRYYSVCGHLICMALHDTAALCLRYGVIQYSSTVCKAIKRLALYTCIALYDLETQGCKVTLCKALYNIATYCVMFAHI